MQLARGVKYYALASHSMQTTALKIRILPRCESRAAFPDRLVLFETLCVIMVHDQTLNFSAGSALSIPRKAS